MIEETIKKLEELFKQKHFSVTIKPYGLISFKVIDFFVRLEKQTDDIILYIKVKSENEDALQQFKVQRTIENQLEKILFQLGVSQVVIPYKNFFDNLNESVLMKGSKQDKQLSSFIYAKLKDKYYRLKLYTNEVVFKIHPYSVEDGTLYFQVRDFNAKDGKTPSLKHYKKLIEDKVLESIYHLGVKKVQMIIKNKKTSDVLSESVEDKLKFIDGKSYSDYLTPVGMISFTVTEPSIEDGIVLFNIKKFSVTKNGNSSFKVDSDTKRQINMIVSDDVVKYGFSSAEMLTQENTKIS